MHKAGSFITLTGETGVDVSACVLLPGRSFTLDADQWLKAMEHARLVCYQLRRRTKMRAWQRLKTTRLKIKKTLWRKGKILAQACLRLVKGRKQCRYTLAILLEE